MGIIHTDGAWAALDPGYKFIGTRNDGWASSDWVQLHGELAAYYGRPAARAQRVSRSRNKASLTDRTVHGIITAPNGKSTYQMTAWGANYIGGKSMKGVHIAGPAKVKSTLAALATKTIVLLGTLC
jgi:hypothetical protein